MTNILLASAKYLTILCFALFTYASFRAQRDASDEKKKGTYYVQRMLVFAVHTFSFACIFINVVSGYVSDVSPISVLILYGAQLLYLIFVMCIMPMFIKLSKGLNNVMCMLMCVGFIIQTRLSFNTGLKHLLFIAVSTVIFSIILILCRKVTFLYRLTWLYYIVGLGLLVVVYVFAKISLGAKINISIGGFSVQPFEFVKIIFVFFVAAAFNKANNFKTVLYTAVCSGVYVIVLVMCSELGTALILAVSYVLILFVATKKILYLLICAVVFVIACIAAYMLFSHVRVRVDVWLNPWADIENKGYQIAQSLFAIGTGGWLGCGLYNGSPKLIPMVANDFVFSAIAEELGAIFAIFLIILCLCFVLMSFRVAIRVARPFYKLLAFGLGSVYGLQVFLTIGGAIKFVPSTGINLPFISSGGSSILASMITVAIIQALYVISENDVQTEQEAIEDRIIEDQNIIRQSRSAFHIPDIENFDDGKVDLKGKFDNDYYEETFDEMHKDEEEGIDKTIVRFDNKIQGTRRITRIKDTDIKTDGRI